MALKISKAIGIIARLRHFLPASVLLNIYNSLIHPYISYGPVVWGQTSKTNLDKILLLQKRALRLICFSNNSEHAIPLFLRSNIPPIDMLYYKSVAVLMHDITHDLAPQNLKNLFTRLASILITLELQLLVNFMLFIHGQNSRTNLSLGLELEFGTKSQSCLNQNQNNYSKNTFRLNCCSF